MFNDTTIFDTDTLTNFPLYRLLFLAKYSLTGNFEWVKAAFSQGQGGFCCEDPDDFVIDDLSNSIYIAGNFSYSAIFDAININTSPGLHGYNFFLAKLQGGVTGIPDVTDPLVNFQLFPNPTSGSVRLIFDAKEKNRLQCEIRNVLGEKVFEKVLTSSDSRNAFDLDISFLPKGIYIIRVSDGVIYENRKLVVE
jgi:hypothetical protein